MERHQLFFDPFVQLLSVQKVFEGPLKGSEALDVKVNLLLLVQLLHGSEKLLAQLTFLGTFALNAVPLLVDFL